MLRKIVSGGQTGADRAALDAALEAGFPAGGYCPRGRLAEDGAIAARYPLVEIDGGYATRTLINVETSDATLVVYDGTLSGGTAQTVVHAIHAGKPFQLIDLTLVEPDEALSAVQGFIAANSVRVLNVAGPRQSSSTAVYAYVHALVSSLLREPA
ncbi:MAG: putative molybdenum carrier protein [Gammaproteobacteria bacterium]